MGERYNKNTELEFLRRNTTLGPIALIKIGKMKQAIDKSRQWYLQMEGELIESDYTLADELEYDLRFQEWIRKCAPLWRQCADNTDLFAFSKMVMYQQIEKVIKIKKRKK